MVPESWTDRELVEALARERFKGPLWDDFATSLARYGIGVLRAWILSGRIFAELSAKSIRYSTAGTDAVPMTSDDATELAVETVGMAIGRFRDQMLVSGRWSANGGSSLAAAFVTQCLFQFPNAHRRWMREQYPHPGLPDQFAGDPDPVSDPEFTVIDRERQRELVSSLGDDLLKAAVQLISEGYSVREAAEHLGVKAKKIENALARYRRKAAARLR